MINWILFVSVVPSLMAITLHFIMAVKCSIFPFSDQKDDSGKENKLEEPLLSPSSSQEHKLDIKEQQNTETDAPIAQNNSVQIAIDDGSMQQTSTESHGIVPSQVTVPIVWGNNQLLNIQILYHQLHQIDRRNRRRARTSTSIRECLRSRLTRCDVGCCCSLLVLFGLLLVAKLVYHLIFFPEFNGLL